MREVQTEKEKARKRWTRGEGSQVRLGKACHTRTGYRPKGGRSTNRDRASATVEMHGRLMEKL
jgi:hypothetical protein